jgi:hypothetical protein
MAISAQEQNFVSESMNMSREILDLQTRIQRMIARWNQNGHFYDVSSAPNGISTQKLQENDGSKHLTSSELTEFVNAITSIDTALGNMVDGNAVHLLKMLP